MRVPFRVPNTVLPGLLFLVCLVFLLTGCTPRPATSSAASASPAPVSVGKALFADVAERVGVRFTHWNGATGKFYYIESTPAGCAFLDFDNDGWQDILLVQSGSSEPAATVQNRPRSALYRNDGKGNFTEATTGSGLDVDLGYAHGVAVGDYDNDGYDDLFITSYRNNRLFYNERGTGKFTDVTRKMGMDSVHSTGYATSAAFGDYDNDGKLDLFVCYYAPWTKAKDQKCDTPNGQDYCSPQLYDPDTPQLWHNEGSKFADVTHTAGIDTAKGRGLAVAFMDYNEDGKQDIFVANDVSANMLWRNDGGGKFTNVATQAGIAYAESGSLMASMGIALADYDHTGRDSMFITNFSDQPKTLFRNAGEGLFEDASMPSGLALPQMKFLSFGCEFFDYDANGWSDLIVANGHVQVHVAKTSYGTTYAERKQLFHNSGDGSFAEITDPAQLGDLAKETVSRGLAVGDFNNDGRMDILVNNQNGAAQLFQNQTEGVNHWVSFRTIGVKSNRNGCHARFTVTASGMKQTATVRAGSSYLSHSDSRVYFGLGNADRADIQILWPSGAKDSLKNVETNHFYTVTEGRGITAAQTPKR